MSTTSSPGRRPFGKPAVSPPSTPTGLCAAGAFAAIDVLSRSISDGRTPAGWFKPGTPVRNTATRSLRGVAGAGTPKSASISTGSVGLVT